jgi:hypothetical protein
VLHYRYRGGVVALWDATAHAPTHYSRSPIDFVAAHWTLSENVSSGMRYDSSGNNLHLGDNGHTASTTGDIYPHKSLFDSSTFGKLNHINSSQLQSSGPYFALAFLWTTDSSPSSGYILLTKGHTGTASTFEYWCSTGGGSGFAFNVGDGTNDIQAYSAFTIAANTVYFCFCQIDNVSGEIWQRCSPLSATSLSLRMTEAITGGTSHIDTNDLILGNDTVVGLFGGSLEDFYIIQNRLFTDAEVDAMFFRARSGRPLLGGF